MRHQKKLFKYLKLWLFNFFAIDEKKFSTLIGFAAILTGIAAWKIFRYAPGYDLPPEIAGVLKLLYGLIAGVNVTNAVNNIVTSIVEKVKGGP